MRCLWNWGDISIENILHCLDQLWNEYCTRVEIVTYARAAELRQAALQVILCSPPRIFSPQNMC
jgi:hypothetical protein